MENENLAGPEYQGAFIQLALFFALVATWFIPAFLFKNMAKRHNKKGWVYFLIGLGVGIACMFITGLIMQVVTQMVGPARALPYLIALVFILPFLLIFISLRFLKNSISTSQ